MGALRCLLFYNCLYYTTFYCPYARQLAIMGTSTHAKCCQFVNVAPHENFQPGRFQSWKELRVSIANARYSVKRACVGWLRRSCSAFQVQSRTLALAAGV